jgi:hypothetical protein
MGMAGGRFPHVKRNLSGRAAVGRALIDEAIVHLPRILISRIGSTRVMFSGIVSAAAM